jgi:Putative zinc-finger
MTDHETFVLLGAKQISEPLSAEEAGALETHLATCPSCRSIAASMRRDDIRLRAELGATKVSPRVRRRVLEEAAGRRRVDPRLLLGLAAALTLAVIGVPLLAGSRVPSVPSPSIAAPSADNVSTPPSSSPASPSAVAPTPSPSASGSGPFVVGNYVYGTNPPRRDTLAAHFEGAAVGEWSRRAPATGEGTFLGGPVTCLVISGSDAWLAGPATTATDGRKNLAVFIHVHDGGSEGEGDTAFMWQTTAGQSLVTMTEWCEKKFIPADGLPLTTGDIVVQGEP